MEIVRCKFCNRETYGGLKKCPHCNKVDYAPNAADKKELEIKSDLEKKWNVLIKYNSDARAAAQKLEKYGQEAVDKLKAVYDVIGHKTQFSLIADQIVADCEEGADENT